MGRLQRMYSDSGMYFVTARTFQARMLLTPSPAVNQAIGGVLARAVALTGVELHAFGRVEKHVGAPLVPMVQHGGDAHRVQGHRDVFAPLDEVAQKPAFDALFIDSDAFDFKDFSHIVQHSSGRQQVPVSLALPIMPCHRAFQQC